MNTNLSFITNEENQSLKERFRSLIRDTSFFDCLVGYFFSSGFYAVYPALENTDKIRILIGIGTNGQTFDMLEQANRQPESVFDFSHAETKQEIEKYFKNDIEEQGLKFPRVEKPAPLFYELNDKEDEIFNKTIDLIANKFLYARYMPMLYYEVKKIQSCVDQILSLKKRNLETDTCELESEIDQMVYELYGLTEEEIKIVEGETK